uniref:Uncharacterized protein n=1 Tax=Tetranychus urticae TaxID=32264 RepID=T1KUR8_TETUR
MKIFHNTSRDLQFITAEIKSKNWNGKGKLEQFHLTNTAKAANLNNPSELPNNLKANFNHHLIKMQENFHQDEKFNDINKDNKVSYLIKMFNLSSLLKPDKGFGERN